MIFRLLFPLTLGLTVCQAPVWAQAVQTAPENAQSTEQKPVQPKNTPISPFDTPARNAVIMDFGTGDILFEKNARAPMPPSSMSKIMTASVVFDLVKSGELSLEQKFLVSEDAVARGGEKSGSSTMFLLPGSRVSVEDLLKGVIVQSGNDACIVLAQGIAGSEAAFVDMMNEKAQALGLDSAHFANATGWPDPNHYISAYDLARLAAHTIKTYPELYTLYSLDKFTWSGVTQPNRNPLIKAGFPGADGLKTGHTSVAKYGFVGSAKQADQRRIFVLNGLQTKAERRSESLRTIRAAFDEFKIYTPYTAGTEIGKADVYMGREPTVGLMTPNDITFGAHRHERRLISARITYQSPIPAPIVAGTPVAALEIMKNGEVIKTYPLNAASDVGLKSALGRINANALAKIRGE